MTRACVSGGRCGTWADVLLGEREVALADLDAVDVGDHRIGACAGREGQRAAGSAAAAPQAPARASAKRRASRRADAGSAVHGVILG